MIQKKTLIFIIGIIILTAGITAAGIYMAKKTAQPEKEGEEETTEEPIFPSVLPIDQEDETVSTVDIDTSDWKTYRNEEYGVQIKFPQEWILTSFENPDLPLSYSITITKSDFKAQPKFSIGINSESWLFKPYLKTVQIENIRINNYQFIKTLFYAEDDPSLGCGERGIIGFQLSLSSDQERVKRDLRVWGSTCKDELFFMALLEKILSALEFF